jgi:hypothetical protein
LYLVASQDGDVTMIHPGLLPILGAGLAVAALTTLVTAQQTPADPGDAALAYAQCMRENGFTEFPDPTPDGDLRIRVTPETTPRFEAAGEACRDLAPDGFRGEDVTPEQLEALLKLSQCIRENGVPDFPDPRPEGSYDLRGVSTGPDDPRIDAAMSACRDVAGGAPIRVGG